VGKRKRKGSAALPQFPFELESLYGTGKKVIRRKKKRKRGEGRWNRCNSQRRLRAQGKRERKKEGLKRKEKGERKGS